MNLPRPPRQSYKAFLWDYDSLSAYSDEECCYSLSEREVQILLAQLDTVSWKTRYKPTNTEISQDTIDRWYGNLARKLMSGCCPDDDALHRFSDEGIYQTSTDGGVTWVDDPENDPRNTYVGMPPLAGVAGNAKRCAAADNVRDLFLQYRDNLIDLLTNASGLIAIMAGILAFIAVIVGVSGAAIGISVLLMGLATALLSETPESVEAQISPAVLDEFKCLVYCRMNEDGQLTYENWLLLLQDIANQFTGFPETFFYQTVNGMGYIGVTNAGTVGVLTASDCDDCCPTCNDKYEPFGVNHGIVVNRTDTYVDVQAQNPGNNVGYVILQATPLNNCCYVNGLGVVGPGSIIGRFFIPCGTPYSEANWINATPEGQCVQMLQVQTQVGAIIRITMSECP
jgi:hypothetical protein